MKKLFLLLFLSGLLFLTAASARAQSVGQQNVILSCLEPTNKDVSVAGGVLNDFTTGLIDEKSLFKEENGPVYVLISYPVPGFKSADSKFSDTCEHRHNSNAEGQYWFCADLDNGNSQCTPEMLTPNTEVMRPADAPKEPSDKEEGPCLKTIFQIDSAAFENGQFTVTNAKMYTLLHNSVKFWGLQFVTSQDQEGQNSTPSAQEISHALKLVSFTNDTGAGTLTPANSNCTAISWDPYGRVIDSLTLEPIPDVVVSLKNANSKNVLELTRNPNNPVFRNPFYTNRQGSFNFAVNPGTYYLFPEHPNFIFPPTAASLQKALAALAIFDPQEEYFQRSRPHGKVYQNSQEAIIEAAGVVERRDIILDPKDPSYQGWVPEFISVQNSRQGIKQLVNGIVSHPKSLIHVYVKNKEIAKTAANSEGEFALLLPEAQIDPTASEFALSVEKIPFVEGIAPLTSAKESFNLLPAALSGFIFNSDLKLVPNAKVDLIVASIGAFPYTTVFADTNGFISLPHQTLPVEEFYLQIQPPSSAQASAYKLTVAQFLKLNQVYLKTAGVNLYNPAVNTEKLATPGEEIVKKVKIETPKLLKNSSPFATLPPSQASPPPPKTKESSSTTVWLVTTSLFLVALLLLTAFFLKRKRQTTLETPTP